MSIGPQTAAAEIVDAMKYRERGEDFREAINRVAFGLRDSDEHYKAIRDILLHIRFVPAGRVKNAIGATRETTPYNCYVSGTIADSYVHEIGCIMDRAKEAAATMRMGGGIGYDFSTLRPRGAEIGRLGSHSSGPISFMHIFNSVCLATSSSGHRRGAQMGVLRVDHPDVEEFVRAKQNTDQLTGFNISLAVTDEFMNAVMDGKEFKLKFDGKTVRTIDAAALWEKIMRSTWDWAEPGILFIDRINDMNNLWYCEKIAATNPCVTGDTEILTREYGYERIEDLVGKTVTIWNGSEWSKVKPEETGQNQPILDIAFSDGSTLSCTPYHGFYLRTGERVEARNLQVGDRLLKHDWPVMGKVTTEDTLLQSQSYAQGFFSGDGWEDQRGRQYIGLYLTKKIVEERLPNHYISRKEYASKDGTGRTFLYYGKGFFLSKTYVPDSTVSLSFRLSWLAGLADADGYLTKDGCLQISSKDRDFLMRVKLMLNTMGATGIVSPMKEGCWRLNISAEYAWHLHNLGLNTTRLQEYCEPARSASRFVMVTEIVEGKQAERVYCFNESKRHAGIFNGVLTANCGEQPLPPFGACLLGSFNLTKYLVSNIIDQLRFGDLTPQSNWKFDEDQLREDIPHIVRAMDNVVDRARYPLAEQRAEALSKRRMGLGVMGLANAGEALGFPYGSKEFLEFQARIFRIIRDETYRASAMLAKEKGAFTLFDAPRYLKGKFIQTLPEDIRELIEKHGIRNSHLTSVAPTGTISLTADNVSSGIEPVFSYEIKRPINTPDGPEIFTIEDYGAKFLGVKGKLTRDVTAQEHIGVLITAQQYVDSSVSKTINMTDKMPWEDFKQLYEMAWRGGAKGCTTFNSSGKRMALLTESNEEAVACKLDTETGQRDCS